MSVIGKGDVQSMPLLMPDNLAEDHGNPTVALPRGHAGGRVVVYRREATADVVWTSHGIPAGEPAVRVDVWHGVFQDDAAGWAILPAGEYQVGWKTSSADVAALPALLVRPMSVFDTAFTNSGDPADWEIRRGNGGSEFSAFRWGAMHGTLAGTFEITPGLTGSVTCGLVARYYSGFHHLRVTSTMKDGRWALRLTRIANQPPDLASEQVIAERELTAAPTSPFTIAWALNGDRHVIALNDEVLLRAREGYMGGVEIVGMFCSTDAVRCSRSSMNTSQFVSRHTVEHRDYIASIRAGNIDRIYLRNSAAPRQNLCWESGIQFGHIGGSEIKFTQGSSLRVLDEGPVATTVTWDGPMPKMVEQSHDVRGHARGTATFYADHIVLADEVLVRTRRSVGPDVDLLGRLMAGPARVVAGGETTFADWDLPADGTYHFLERAAAPIFPVAAAFPLRLGDQQWWLMTLVMLRFPTGDRAPSNSAFAWQCPSGLTASHDFRCTPTVPGTEYAYTIVVAWRRSDDRWNVEQELLQWRDAWTRPMTMEPIVGSVVQYRADQNDTPEEAGDFDGCFDRRSGRYVVAASNGRMMSRLDPQGVARRNTTIAVRAWPEGGKVACAIDGAVLGKAEFVCQRGDSGELWLRLQRVINRPVTLDICSQEGPE